MVLEAQSKQKNEEGASKVQKKCGRVQHMMRSCRAAAVTHRIAQDDGCLSLGLFFCFFLVSCTYHGLSMGFRFNRVCRVCDIDPQWVLCQLNCPQLPQQSGFPFSRLESTSPLHHAEIPVRDGLHKRILLCRRRTRILHIVSGACSDHALYNGHISRFLS